MAAAASAPPVERHLAPAAAAVVWSLGVAIPAGLAVLVAMSPTADSDAWALPTFVVVGASWSLVGGLVTTRRPRHPVGWLLWGTGVVMGLTLLGQAYALVSVTRFGGTLPLTAVGWWSGILFSPALALALVGLPLTFPDGRLPSRRWRWLAVIAGIAMAAATLAMIVMPGDLQSFSGVPNPTGIAELGGIAATVSGVGNAVFLACLPACAVMPFLRFRRGNAIERQQLKWFGSVAALGLVGILAATLLPQEIAGAAFVVTTIAVGLMPVAIAIAILRYRLYDIDRIVGRTVAYALVTAILAVTFVGLNLVLQALLAGFTGSSTLVTAASTLAVAFLVQPLRRRVQAPIDRRFNRAQVDASLVVAAFAAQARDLVDLARLRSAVLDAATDSVAPAAASLWLRGSTGNP